MLIDVCLLVYVMHLLLLKDVWLLYSLIFVKRLLRFSWMIFSIYGTYFYDCLRNLDRVLQRCEQTNLVLNWEKCHFMVNEGIAFGYKFLNEVLRQIKLKLMQSRKWHVLKILKVFVVSSVMLVSIGGLLKTSLKFLGLLLIFYERMFHLFFMMIL